VAIEIDLLILEFSTVSKLVRPAYIEHCSETGVVTLTGIGPTMDINALRGSAFSLENKNCYRGAVTDGGIVHVALIPQAAGCRRGAVVHGHRCGDRCVRNGSSAVVDECGNHDRLADLMRTLAEPDRRTRAQGAVEVANANRQALAGAAAVGDGQRVFARPCGRYVD